MTHSELEPQLDAYLDGELAPARRAGVEDHLKECRDVLRLRAERVALRSAIRASSPRHAARRTLSTRVRMRSAQRGDAASPSATLAAPVPRAGPALRLAASLRWWPWGAGSSVRSRGRRRR